MDIANFTIKKSNAINIIKTILAIGIASSHASFLHYDVAGIDILESNIFDSYRIFICVLQSFTCVCVPLFFFISGYLFFLNSGGKVCKVWVVDKIQKRAKSLLLPFFIANIITFILVLAANSIKPNLIPIGDVSIDTISFHNILSWLWIEPLMAPTWFLKDLFIICLFTPLIYAISRNKKLGLMVVCLLLVGWAVLNYMKCNPLNKYGLSIHSLCFFSIGCIMSIHRKDIFQKNKVALILSLLTIIGSILTLILFPDYSEVVRLPLLLTLAYFYLQLCLYCSKEYKMKWAREAALATFFVYIYHGILVIADKHLLLDSLMPTNSWQALGVYILTVVILYAQVLFCYFLLKKICPEILSLMIGGR